MSRIPRSLGLGVLLAALAPAALAQPDPDAAPSAGTVALETGFGPNPYTMDLTAGGGVEAATASAGCVGYVSAAPSVVLDYGGGGDDHLLYLFVRSSSDTVLLVRTPAGDWMCNDDLEGSDPGLYIADAAEGRYAVWVGTYADTESAGAPATFHASEREVTRLDAGGDPTSGTADLDAGFAPDPHEVAVTAGGPLAMFGLEGCTGYVDPNAPTFALDYDADGSGALYVYAQAPGGEDLTLAVVGPDDALHCNDDAGDLNPGLAVEAAPAGRYAVWVGTYAEGEASVPATLFFSGVEGPVAGFGEEYPEDGEYVDGGYEGGEAISRFAAPAHGTLTLGPGFGSEEVAVAAGGADAVSVTGMGCAGYIANGEPDLNVLYGDGDEAGGVLAFSTESGDDTTLLVNLPDGSWRCSDDEIDRNPVVVVEAAAAGLYNVWVGSYSQDASGAPATLRIAERDPR